MPAKSEAYKSTLKGSRRRKAKKADSNDENRLPNVAALEPLWKEGSDNGSTGDRKKIRGLADRMEKFEERVKSGIFESNDVLRETIARCSVRLGTVNDGSDSLLLLCEHESRLVKASRLLVKDATQKKSEKEILPRLCLATHVIRALSRFVLKASTQECLMQVLYHVMNTLGNAKFTEDSDLIFLGFEALHHILLRYKRQSNGLRISFATTVGEEIFVFAVPVYKKDSEAKEESGLGLDKLCAIAVQVAILVSRSVFALTESQNNSLPKFLRRLDSEPLLIARKLLTTVAAYWTHHFVKITKQVTEGISHCRRIHRLLWEQAMIPERSPKEQLLLRQDSISCLLFGDSATLCRALENKFAETACVYAWKASIACYSDCDESDVINGDLVEFHERLGPSLDRMYEGSLGLSYLEYCTVRAHHSGMIPPKQRRASKPESATQAMQRLALMSVAVIRGLASKTDVFESLKVTESSANEVRGILLDPNTECCLNSEDVSRILRIIPITQMHKSLYLAANNDSVATTKDILRIGGYLLAFCIGPFLLRAASTMRTERTQLCEKGIECFLRGVALWEKVVTEPGERNKSLDASLELSRFVTEGHLLNQTTLPLFERFAKLLSNSGRQREEKGDSFTAIRFHVASLRLLTDICSESVQASDLMLSQRWSYLSSLFASNGMADASILAGLLALIYDAFETPQNSETLDLDLIKFVCTRSNGVLDVSHGSRVPPLCGTERRRGMIARLLRCLRDLDVSSYDKDDSSESGTLTASVVVSCFEGVMNGTVTKASRYVEETCAVPFYLSGILRAMLPRNTIPFEKSQSPHSSDLAKVRMLVDLIREVGSSLQSGFFQSDESFQRMLRCHKTMSRLAVGLVQSLKSSPLSNGQVSILKSTLFCVASSSILPFELCGAEQYGERELESRDSTHDILLSSANALTALAISSLSEVVDSEWRAFTSALRPIFLYLRQIGCNTTENELELIHSLDAAMEQLLTPKSPPEILAAQVLMSFVSHRAEILHARGQGFTALRLAHWSYYVASYLDSASKEEKETAYLRMMSPCTIFSHIRDTSEGEVLVSEKYFDDIELLANREQCKMVVFADHLTAERICSNVKEKLAEYEATSTNISEHAHYIYWVKGTLTQTLAMAYKSRGNLEKAAVLYKQCLRLSKQTLLASLRQLSDVAKCKGTAISDLSAIQRTEVRQTELLVTLAWIYRLSGDYRRADTYLRSAIKCVPTGDLYAVADLSKNADNVIESLYSLKLDNPRVAELRRIIWDFAVSKSTQDMIVSASSAFPKKVMNGFGMISEDDKDLDRLLENVSRLKLCEYVGMYHEKDGLLHQSREILATMKSRFGLNDLAKLFSGTISPVPEAELDLCDARRLLRSDSDPKQEMIAERKCAMMLKAPLVSPVQRSEALYLLGLAHVRSARESGSLSRLWHGYSNQEGTRLLFESENDDSLSRAKQCLVDALHICGPASDIMTRNILRSLALVCGPEENSKTTMPSWEMIHSSLGSSLGHRTRQGLGSEATVVTGDDAHNELLATLRSLDLPFFSQERSEGISALIRSLEALLPRTWSVLGVVMCPTGEILLNSVTIDGAFVSKTVCIFPDELSPVFETMMQPLDSLIAESQGQLQGDTKQHSDSDDTDHKRKWWSKRERIDNELDALSRKVERCFFNSASAQALLLGETDDRNSFLHYDWTTQNAPEMDETMESPLKDAVDPMDMRADEIRQELVERGMAMSDLRKIRKAELANILKEERRRGKPKAKSDSTIGIESETEKSTLLILDEDLQRFPFEALPCLRERIVCRSPSISFVAAKLQELHQSGGVDRVRVDPKQSCFILDPEGNLQATRKRMSDFLMNERKKQGTEWEQVVGEAPTKSFFTRNLVRDASMFLFFGHGGAQAYFSRSDIENLLLPGVRSVKAAIVLMGCSSGRLVSVNRKKLIAPRKVPLLFEPEGLAQTYIAAGAPCVIGNLWDVTDRDIDRFSIDMLSRFYGGEDLAGSLVRARSVCKMRFLNGHAPVYYGIPVFPIGYKKIPVAGRNGLK